MREISLTIEGEPMGKARPIFARTKNKTVAITPKKTRDYETYVKEKYMVKYGDRSFPKDIPLKAEITAYFAIPKSKKRKIGDDVTKRPDLDNIIKIILDALNKVAYHDDAQISEVTCNKKYALNPKVEIKITPLKK